MRFVCSQGAEALLTRELQGLGAITLLPGRAQVRCSDPPAADEAGIGGLRVALRACLSSHLCSRVLWPVGDFAATDAESLYAGAAAIDWARLLRPGSTFAVRCRRSEGQLHHGPYVAQVVKDALVDSLRRTRGERPDVDRQSPDVSVQIAIHHGRAEVALDLAGRSLHERGLRTESGPAPLKEHVAAAMLMHAGWPQRAAIGAPLIDPMCGTGTLLLEAALMARGMPPNALRERFAVEGIAAFPPALWRQLRQEARSAFAVGRAAPRPAPLRGYDIDFKQVRRAQAAFAALGLPDDADIAVADVRTPPPVVADGPAGLIVTNPPYGERLGGEQASVLSLYASLGQWLRAFAGWRAAVLVADKDSGHALGLRADKMHAMYNGALPVTLLHLPIHAPRAASAAVEATDAAPVQAPTPEQTNSDFARRLHKNVRSRARLSKRGGWGAFRAYDADVPEYRAAIDVYDAEDGTRWAYVQPYQAHASIDARRAETRVRHMVLATPAVLGIEPRFVVVYERARQRPQKPSGGYGMRKDAARFFTVREHDCVFYVSLEAYVDTGVYLDLRVLRAHIQQRARGKRILNLFGYTATMCVAAAKGGAAATVTVDKSATYLDWAAQNFSANAMAAHRHMLVRSDIDMYLAQSTDGDEPFDIIYVGAPTYSVGKSGGRTATFDIERDHVKLLTQAMARLGRDGELWFVTHARKFRLDEEALRVNYDIVEKTAQFCPPDFTARRPHRLWRLAHRQPTA